MRHNAIQPHPLFDHAGPRGITGYPNGDNPICPELHSALMVDFGPVSNASCRSILDDTEQGSGSPRAFSSATVCFPVQDSPGCDTLSVPRSPSSSLALFLCLDSASRPRCAIQKQHPGATGLALLPQAPAAPRLVGLHFAWASLSDASHSQSQTALPTSWRERGKVPVSDSDGRESSLSPRRKHASPVCGQRSSKTSVAKHGQA